MNVPVPTPEARAVVTGASSGIGEALACSLARRGHSVILVARRIDRLRTLADRLATDHGIDADVLACDLADRSRRAELAAELASREISVLCNNAGFASYGDLATLDPVREREQVELNTVAVHDLTLAVLPGMLARRSGAILVTGSTAGNQPGPGNTTYAASKAFANTFAESLSGELRGTGVTCSLLAPGPVRTEFSTAADLPRLERLLPAPLWVGAEQAAEAAIEGMAKGRRRIVPGAFAKVQTFGGQFGPRSVSGPLLRAAYSRIA